MKQTNSAIDLLSYHTGTDSNGSLNQVSQRITVNDFAAGNSPVNLRITLRIELNGLANTLLEMRRWLSEHGCRHQVFHCVRVGSEAVINLEFDSASTTLLAHFRERFGTSAKTLHGSERPARGFHNLS
jgi:hypothetical protein